MTMHRYHSDPDYDDPPYAILYDGCDRCDEHAAQLTSLDRDNLTDLWSMMVADSLFDGPSPYRTVNERRAGNQLYRMAVLMERLGVDPWTLTPPHVEAVTR